MRDYINKRAKETLIGSIDIEENKEFVSEVMRLPLRELEAIDDIKLSKYIISLSQYIVFLRKQVNFANLKYFMYKRQYDEILATAMASVKAPTLKEKRQIATENNQDLKILDDRISQFDAEKMMLDKMDDSIIHYMNALKKEQSRRENEKYSTKR